MKKLRLHRPTLMLLCSACWILSAGCGKRELAPFIKDVQVAAKGGAFCVSAHLPEHRTAQLVFSSPNSSPVQLYYSAGTGWPSQTGWPILDARKLLYIETFANLGITYAVAVCDLATEKRKLLARVSKSGDRLHSLRIVGVSGDGRRAVLEHSSFSSGTFGHGGPDVDERDWCLESLDLSTGRLKPLTPAFRAPYTTRVVGVDAALRLAFIQTSRGIAEWQLEKRQGELAAAPVRFRFGSRGYAVSIDGSGRTCAAFLGVEPNPDTHRVPGEDYLTYEFRVWQDGKALVLGAKLKRGTCALSPRGERVAWEQRPVRGRAIHLNTGQLDGSSYVPEHSIRLRGHLRGLAWLGEQMVLAYDERRCFAVDATTGERREVLHLDTEGRLRVP